MNTTKTLGISLLLIIILMGVGSCRREYNGTVTFYFDNNGPNATVQINGQTGTVTANYQNLPPVCGASAVGCANFILPTGTYNYNAQSSTTSWSGTVTITANGCAEIDLTQSTGSVTFWTSSPNYGTITANINGETGQFSSYFTGGAPLCGDDGTATFNLAPGTYSYTASSSDGVTTWGPNIVSVTADGCKTLELQ